MCGVYYGLDVDLNPLSSSVLYKVRSFTDSPSENCRAQLLKKLIGVILSNWMDTIQCRVYHSGNRISVSCYVRELFENQGNETRCFEFRALVLKELTIVLGRAWVKKYFISHVSNQYLQSMDFHLDLCNK
jgi:hypothetical protein